MAMPGQIKTRIDLLKKKIESQSGSLPPERQRRQRKQLRRLQRARRRALALEKRAHPPKKEVAEAKEGEAPSAPPA
jgi:hypothetical protein